MLNHEGFHCGRLGLWDPRTDAVFLNINEIKKKSLEIGTEHLIEHVYPHEWSHRNFYHTNTMRDIAAISAWTNEIIERHPREELDESQTKFIRYNVPRLYRTIKEIDPILDAYFALMLYHGLGSSFGRDLEPKEFWRILSLNLHDRNAERIFYDLYWLYNQTYLLKRRSPLGIPYAIIMFALQAGIREFHLLDKAHRKPTSREVFDIIVDMMKNSDKEGVRKYFQFVKRLDLPSFEIVVSAVLNDIKSDSPTLDTELQPLVHARIVNEKSRRRYHKFAARRIFGRWFEYYGEVPDEPAFKIIEVDDRYIFQRRKHTSKTRFTYHMVNLLWNHAQETLR